MRARPVTSAIGASERVGGAVWRSRGRRVLAVATGVVALLEWSPSSARAATAHVQYVSAANVYLDAGLGAGLKEGATVRVERQGRPIAALVVEFVAQSSAACKVQSSTGPVRVGDDGVFTPSPTVSAGGAASGAGAGGSAVMGTAGGGPRSPGSLAAYGSGSRQSVWSSLDAVRGRVATLYTRSTDPAGTFGNPTFLADLRCSGRGREQVRLRARADRPVFAARGGLSPGGAEPAAVRIYELQAHYRSPAQGLELEVGRLLPVRIEPMGYVDGGGLRWRPAAQLLLGVVGGRGSELGAREFKGSGRRLGGFVEVGTAQRNGLRRWRTLLAAALLEDPGITRRQFALLRTDATFGRRWRAFQNLEVDVNPPWKRRLGEPHLALAAWSLSGHAQLQRRLSLMRGVDARRDMLLPEQRGLPVTADRRVQHGVHGSANLQLAGTTSLRLGGDVRRRPGGQTPTRSWDTSLYAARLFVAPLAAAVHASGYDADFGRGVFVDGSLGVRAGSRLRLDLSAGTGTTRTSASLPMDSAAATTRSRWLRAAVDLQAGYGMWLDAAGEWRADGMGRELALELGRAF